MIRDFVWKGEHVFIHCGTCDDLCFFLEHHDTNQLSSWSRPFSDWGSRILCLLPHVKQKAKQMGGCWSCPGSKVFFGARMFFFNIPHLLDNFEIMLNHGIVDELVVFFNYQRTSVKIYTFTNLHIFTIYIYIYIYIRIVSLLTMESCVLFQEVHQHLSSPIDSQEVQWNLPGDEQNCQWLGQLRLFYAKSCLLYVGNVRVRGWTCLGWFRHGDLRINCFLP